MDQKTLALYQVCLKAWRWAPYSSNGVSVRFLSLLMTFSCILEISCTSMIQENIITSFLTSKKRTASLQRKKKKRGAKVVCFV